MIEFWTIARPVEKINANELSGSENMSTSFLAAFVRANDGMSRLICHAHELVDLNQVFRRKQEKSKYVRLKSS
jgi:hypothetical protein